MRGDVRAERRRRAGRCAVTGFRGMETEQVRGQGRRVRAAARQLELLREHLGTVVAATGWAGPDAEAFRGRWADSAAPGMTAVCGQLTGLAGALLAEAGRQDLASGPDPLLPVAEGRPRPAPDGPGIPDRLEGAGQAALSPLGALVADRIGWGVDPAMELIAGSAAGLGLDTDGLVRFRGDAAHLGGLIGDWASGERVPTLAELGASALLVGGTGLIAPVELFTDTGFLDPRTAVTVHAVTAVSDPSTPQDLADLIRAHDEARREMFDRTGTERFDGHRSGQIRIQTVQTPGGGQRFIVHAPPTGGAGILSPAAWGAQGNSAGWDSDLRSMAGQASAAMADVRAAMSAPGPDGAPLVPAGAEVLLVGHSQGGLTAAQLVADPTFNSTSGAAGSYDVTHSFSIGSPVQTVVPAQGSTQVVNVAHDPVWERSSLWPEVLAHPSHIADPVPRLDLGGYRVDGSRVSAPNVREAWLPAPVQTYGESSQLHNAHDSVLLTARGADPTGGYYGSVRRHTGSDPVLSALQRDLEGRYLGAGVAVVSDRIVEVGREDLR